MSDKVRLKATVPVKDLEFELEGPFKTAVDKVGADLNLSPEEVVQRLASGDPKVRELVTRWLR